ncbi:hypothetical protein GCM10010315_50070 [Streptomyces luteosporeus]|uniref:Uncharacterized protein n=1 Tax=Streptomyces luteosporeus TaxID=173856 RepID=A0ABP6GGZ1_9ACTN
MARTQKTRNSGGVVRAVIGKKAKRTSGAGTAALPGTHAVWRAVPVRDGGPHPVHPAWLHAQTGRRES